MKKEKSNKISVYLIKEEFSLDDVLKKKDYKKEEFSNGNIFYYDESYTYKPSWISGFFGNKLDEVQLLNQSSKGVYFVKVAVESNESKKRLFAIPFGYGHSMIEKNYCEDDFGLKTTLNLVDSNSIRKVGKRTLSSEPKNTIEQLSKIGSISDFGIDIEQDLIEEITGKPNDTYFGDNAVTGKVAFTASVKVNSENVDEFLKKCFEYYKKEKYKENFDFIDWVKEIKNTEEWNEKLIKKLKNNNESNINVWMAIPEIIQWEDVAGFSYTKKQGNLVNDITIEGFEESLSEKQKNELNINFLKKNKVFCFRSSPDEEYNNWSYFQCLYCEIKEGDRTIILVNGKWYKIAKDFVKEVEENYKTALENSFKITLIECQENEHEAEYNEALAKSIKGGILMDRKTIVYGGGSSSVEFCDVYDSKNKTFIHVKNYYGSSALSHLFAQGRVSGELFLSDIEFRKKVKEKEQSLPFNPEEKPKANDYKIIFGIISNSGERLNLPFFSKVNFKSELRRLDPFGFKNVSLIKIKRK